MPATAKATNYNFKGVDKDYLNGLECQLKDLWSKYVKCLDENGFDEKAKALREKYFATYQSYRNNKKWREIMNN